MRTRFAVSGLKRNSQGVSAFSVRDFASFSSGFQRLYCSVKRKSAAAAICGIGSLEMRIRGGFPRVLRNVKHDLQRPQSAISFPIIQEFLAISRMFI